MIHDQAIDAHAMSRLLLWLTRRMARLGPDPLPLIGSLLETPPGGCQGQLSRWMAYHNLSSLVSQQHHSLVTQRTFSHLVTLLVLFHQPSPSLPQACTQQWALALLLETHSSGFLPLKPVLMLNLLLPIPPCLSSV
jgi:hypothetical protein